MYKSTVTLLALLFLLLLLQQPVGAELETAVSAVHGVDITRSDQLSFTSADIKLNTANNYTSAVIAAPISFNAVVPQWRIHTSPDSELELMLRTGKTPQSLGDWYPVNTNPDWMLADGPEFVGDMLFLPTVEGLHQYVQYKISLTQTDKTASSILEELQLTFIDSTNGPTAAELAAQQQALDSTHGADPAVLPDEYPKPPVISREVWCVEDGCNYDASELEYYPVSHLILHHTVTGTGDDGDSAAIVRAIWEYHTNTLGWGDIGYNFLADMDGLIYEGHLGGDDVVGIHARNANAGSLGLALLGDFRYVYLSDPMFNAAVDLFAWKADQRGIDLFDASNVLPNVDYGLPHVMGHRDYAGETICPGDHAHDELPAIRDAAAARIGQVSPHIYVDELSSAFTKANVANWYEPIYNCGHNTHAWYTWSTLDPNQSTNWGEWRPEIPLNGRYQIEMFVPYCNTGAAETIGAHYTIQHANGSSDVIIDQDADVGLWISLGEYDLNAGNETVVHLTDLTAVDEGFGVWFDAMRLLPVKIFPSAINTIPADGTWLNQKDVLFAWTIEEPEQVLSTTLQVATDATFSNLIVEASWDTAVYSSTQSLENDQANLYWRIQLTDVDQNLFFSPATHFGIDSTPPESAVTKLYYLSHLEAYSVIWTGTDSLNSVANYNIDYRTMISETVSAWIPWQVNTPATNALFSPLDPTLLYQFRSQAGDTLGNIEPAHVNEDISSDQAISLPHAIMLPITNSK